MSATPGIASVFGVPMENPRLDFRLPPPLPPHSADAYSPVQRQRARKKPKRRNSYHGPLIGWGLGVRGTRVAWHVV